MRRLRIALAVVGVLSFLMSLFMTALSIVWVVDMMMYGDTADVIVFVIIALTAVLLLVEGVLMFVLPARMEKLERAGASEAGAAAAGAAPVAPRQVGEDEHEVPAQPAGPSDAPEIDETMRMFHRSNDVFATARDIVRMHDTNPASSRGLTHLATMLATLGLNEWEQAPECEVALLNRTHSYWLRGDTSELNKAGYDRFVATEAAMNLDLALRDIAEVPYDTPLALTTVAHHLQSFVHQDVASFDFAESLGKAYPGVEPGDTPGEWYARACVVNAAECVRVPFRMSYDLRANVQARAAVLALEIPRPDCLKIVSAEANVRADFARAYAIRLSWLMASLVLSRVPKIEILEVQCHEHGSADTLLAISFTRDLVSRMAYEMDGETLEHRRMPRQEGIRYVCDASGWFVSVSPHISWDDEAFDSPEWFVYPELSERELGDAARRITGARRLCDMGINESAPRMRAADELHTRLQASDERSYETVVAALVDIRDATKDVALVEACERTIGALLDGSIDPADEMALRASIVSDGALQVAAERASKLIEDDEHADPQEAIGVLRQALSPILEFGFYADDESCVYRYFGSLSERIVYNTNFADPAREVRLVPDSYYNALGLLASAHNMLGQSDEAIAVAEEMMRIAPASVDASMRKVRALENESRILEAESLIRERAAFAATPRDAAFALYRLAYMEWKLGREDLAAACYVRALAWNTPFWESANSELEDLLGAYPKLKRPEADEAVAALAREGIPVGFTDSQRELTLAAAALMCDEHSFIVAQSLLAVVCAATGDDVYAGIHRTLGR